MPFAWVPAAANKNDCTVFAPTMQAVLARGLLADVETVHLDRGHDTAGVRDICSNFGVETVTAKIRPRNKDKSKKTKVPVTFGMGWPVERTPGSRTSAGSNRSRALDMATRKSSDSTHWWRPEQKPVRSFTSGTARARPTPDGEHRDSCARRSAGPAEPEQSVH